MRIREHILLAEVMSASPSEKIMNFILLLKHLNDKTDLYNFSNGKRLKWAENDWMFKPVDFNLTCVASDSHNRAKGLRFNFWRTDALLGKGAQGSVYQAAMTYKFKNGQFVLAKHPCVIKTFAKIAFGKQEYSIGKILPAVRARAISSSENDVAAYLEMRYVPGSSLKSLMESNPQLPSLTRLKIAINMVKALIDVHNQSVIHGDVKPANIMISQEVANMIDFGMSIRKINRPTHSGTPNYIAPEVYTTGISELSDVFSMARTLGEFFGQKDFQAAILSDKKNYLTGKRAYIFSPLFIHLNDLPAVFLQTLAQILNHASHVDKRQRASLSVLCERLEGLYAEVSEYNLEKETAELHAADKAADDEGSIAALMTAMRCPIMSASAHQADSFVLVDHESPKEWADVQLLTICLD